VDEVLSTGYMAQVEAAYGRGEIEDYFMFPAGKLRRGIVPVERATKQPLDKTAIRTMFVDVERKAGVEHQEAARSTAFAGRRRTSLPSSRPTRGC